jgi:hypothetical protein
VEHAREIVEAGLERHGASVYTDPTAIKLALLPAATARWRPMSRFVLILAAAAALAVGASACDTTITVPDQGVIVNGCQTPAQCFRADCACTRAAVAGSCVIGCTITTPGDPSTCDCLPVPVGDMGATVDTQCIETAQACVGRGVFCGGAGALCKSPTSPTCDGTGDPPMLIPTFGMPILEPHCQYVDDVCCPGITDGGMPMTD